MSAQKENLGNYQDAYNADFKFTNEAFLMHTFYAKRLCGAMRTRNCKNILSLGIGHQYVSEAIIDLFKSGMQHYVVVEGSPEIINSYKKTLGQVPAGMEIVESYFEEFDTKEKFDAIEMGFVLEHVDDPAVVVNRFKKFINPDGKIFITVPNARSMHRQLGNLAGFLPDVYQLSKEDHQLGHKRYFDLKSLSKLVVDCGLKVDKTEGLYLKPFTTAQLNSLNLKPEVYEALLVLGIEHPDLCNSLYIEASLK